jgi:hypothetical protein
MRNKLASEHAHVPPAAMAHARTHESTDALEHAETQTLPEHMRKHPAHDSTAFTWRVLQALARNHNHRNTPNSKDPGLRE